MNVFGTMIVLSAFGAGVVLAGTALAQTPSLEDHTFEQTCSYFEKRNVRLRRSVERAWLPVVAESCRAALVTLAKNPANATDRTYLERLSELRSVVIGMNVARFTERQSGTGRRPQIRVTVTGSGEFLIAHHLGVIDAYHDWAHENGIETAALPAAQ